MNAGEQRNVAEAILVLVTCASREQADEIAGCLVRERLAACVNVVGPIRSVYRWKGAVEDQAEHLLMVKTRAELFEKLAARVRELHSYEVPEVIAVPIVSGLPEYLAWIERETGPAGE